MRFYEAEAPEKNVYYAFALTEDDKFFRLAVWLNDLGSWSFGWRNLLLPRVVRADFYPCNTMGEAVSVLRAKFGACYGEFETLEIGKLKGYR